VRVPTAIPVLLALVLTTPAICGQDIGVLPNADAPLTTPTPDGSGQVTEPSIVDFPGGWHGFKYWLAVAPYRNSHAVYENPSILVSDNGVDWAIPPGGSNPVERPNAKSHLADPDLFYDEISDQLWLYYISEDQYGFTDLMRTTSADGVRWNTPEIVIRTPNYRLVMPAVAKIREQYWLWTVNAGKGGCSASSTLVQYRTSWDGVHWSAPHLTDIVQPGYKIWHISATVLEPGRFLSVSSYRDNFGDGGRLQRREPEEPRDRPFFLPGIYAMLASAFDANCGHDNLFFMLSRDGVHWVHFPRPLLTPNPGHWDGSAIYQSALAFDRKTDLMSIWYSALDGSSWHLGLTQGDFRKTVQALRGSGSQ